MDNLSGESPLQTAGWQLRCPVCQGVLHVHGSTCLCAQCHGVYHCTSGIWRLLPEEREKHYATFLQQYQCVRKDEGWGDSSPAYYRQLPWVARQDPQHDVWSLRARHYQALVRMVLEPLERRRHSALKVLDLGAGNGWLSSRLSQRGHRVAAIDINLDPLDGLGACGNYDERFLVIQAEFDHLPMASGQADLIIYNGSLHYSSNYEASLQEGFRALRTDGQLVMVDSPVYSQVSDGQIMVLERQAQFIQRYGFASNLLASENYLTWSRLTTLGRSLGCSWHTLWPMPLWRRVYGSAKARLSSRRWPARFPIIQIAPYPKRQLPFARRLASQLWRPLLRLGYRWDSQERAQHVHVEKVNGQSIVVFPDVFNPRSFGSGLFLARQLNSKWVPPGCSLLDMGTGTGIGAIVAAQWARRVVAVDINMAAVRCAQENIRRHNLDDRVEARHGDLFSSLGCERYDVVLFNPPFLRGLATSILDQAFFSSDIAIRFSEHLAEHLNTHGYALLVLSTIGDAATFLQALRWHGFRIETVVEQNWRAERFTLYKVIREPHVCDPRPATTLREGMGMEAIR